MRILGIDTASRRGSVALVENSASIASATHEEANAHGEQILPLVDRLMAEAGWRTTELDRIAVGVGPGSFTGLRVGIAAAQGIGLALGIPVLGIGSLRAMAAAVPETIPGVRIALLDARRQEYFVAAYDALGNELAPPWAIRCDAVSFVLAERFGAEPAVLLGEVCEALLAEHTIAPGASDEYQSCPTVGDHKALQPITVVESGSAAWVGLRRFQSPHCDLPHAHFVAWLAQSLDPNLHPGEPHYVRGPDAVLPNLPPSPLDKPRV